MIYDFGNKTADTVLIQMIDRHDLESVEKEVRFISEATLKPFRLITIEVNDWNRDLSPWEAPGSIW